MKSRRALVMSIAALMVATLLSTLTSSFAWAETLPFRNIDDIAQGLNFGAWAKAQGSHTVRIAVLDNGFRGHGDAIGKSLPASTVYHAGPVAVDAGSEESHGLFMAQLIAGLLAHAPGIRYELHLYSAFGYSNLSAAIDDVITRRMDIVLYAQVWEYGGNGDGRGFINSLVNRATAAGVLWINAAGNFADSTVRSDISRGADDWVRLPGPNDTVRVRCDAPKDKTCALRAVLSWNDFKDQVSEGTDKDLDLVLSDDTLKILQNGGLQQKKSFPEGQPGYSLYPREIVQAEVKAGLYFLRVKIRSENFGPDDELRINVSGDHVRLLDATRGETLLPPADNSTVITVGAIDSEKSSDGFRSRKPELRTPSLVVLENGDQYKGSSNAAAIATAAVAALNAIKPELARETAINALTELTRVGQGGLSLDELEFGPLGPGCFQLARLPWIPAPARALLAQGVVSVATTAGLKIFTATDPFSLVGHVTRSRPDDMLVVSDQGFTVHPRSRQAELASGGVVGYEVVEQPRGTLVCGIDGRRPLAGPLGGPESHAPEGSVGLVRLPDPARL